MAIDAMGMPQFLKVMIEDVDTKIKKILDMVYPQFRIGGEAL